MTNFNNVICVGVHGDKSSTPSSPKCYNATVIAVNKGPGDTNSQASDRKRRRNPPVERLSHTSEIGSETDSLNLVFPSASL